MSASDETFYTFGTINPKYRDRNSPVKIYVSALDFKSALFKAKAEAKARNLEVLPHCMTCETPKFRNRVTQLYWLIDKINRKRRRKGLYLYGKQIFKDDAIFEQFKKCLDTNDPAKETP